MDFFEKEKQSAYKTLYDIQNKYTGNERAEYLEELYRSAVKFKSNKNLVFAEVFLIEAMDQLLDEDTLLNAKVLHSLGSLYNSINMCKEARPLIIRSLEIKKKLNLYNNKTTINSLLVLGWIESKSTNFKDALSALNMAYNLAEKINKLVEISLLSLGELYIRTQQYEKAEMLMIRALNLSIYKNNAKMIGHCLDTLGYLYSETGNYDEAYKKFETSYNMLKNQEDMSKKLFYPALLHRRAALCIKTGQYPKAKSLLLQSLKLKKKHNRLSVPYAIGLHDLAYLCIDTGRYCFAEKLLKKGELILNMHPSQNQILQSDFLRTKADLYKKLNRYLDAELAINKVLDIESENSSAQSKSRLISCYNASFLYYKNGKYTESISMSEKSLSIAVEIIHDIFHYNKQDTANKYRQYIIKTFHLYLSLHYRINNKHDYFNTFLLIYYKAGQIFATNHTANVFFENVNSDDLDRRNEFMKMLQEKGDQLFKLRYSINLNTEITEDKETRILKLEAEINDIEINIRQLENQIIPKYRNIIGNKELEIKCLQNFFKEDDIVLEFIKYYDTFEELEQRYCVLIYYPTHNPSVTIHHFSDTRRIEDIVLKLLQFCSKNSHANQNTAEIFNKIRTEVLNKLSKDLYNEIIKSIEKFTNKATHLTICLDGELIKIPFELLFENKKIKYLNSISDAFWLNNHSGKSTSTSIIAYDSDYSNNKNKDFENTNQFAYLPGTIIEGTRVTDKLKKHNIKYRKITGSDFTKEKFLRITRPCILHIATHGFYVENDCKNTNFNEFKFKKRISNIDDPYERSGFVLSGINSSFEKDTDKFKDHIITAKDILNMNLYGTQLVVLSICNSGQGDIWNGDGIYGLQRALFLSGIKTLVMSLWNADDLATCILMDKMYDGILNKKRVDQSLLEAKDYIKNSSITEFINDGWEPNLFTTDYNNIKNKSFKPYQSPYYWSCFICMGGSGVITF